MGSRRNGTSRSTIIRLFASAIFVTAAPALAAEASENFPPPAHSGFQLALRTGYAIPIGSFSRDDDWLGADMSLLFPWQVPVTVDVGWKLGHHFFLGGYFGIGVGDAGPTLGGRDCSSFTSVPSCSTFAFTYRVGAEVQYQFLPAQLANPWVGYGFGFESSKATNSPAGEGDITITGTGLEYGHLMGGVDFRVSRWVGVGPYIDCSIGQFTHARWDQGGSVIAGPIEAEALHGWLSFGVRGVLFP